MLEEDSELYQCNITIKEIKLTVKFPCKLTLNYQNKLIKADVTADSTGKYIIEREVKTKSQNGDPIEILIHLTTEKGGNIMAGIIKLNPKDLSLSQGQSLTVGLQKCLDQSASCLLKVQRVWLTKTSKAKSLTGEIQSRNRKAFGDDLIGSGKKPPPTIVDNYRNVQTRSQLPGFHMKKPLGSRKEFGFEASSQANKLYGLGPKSYVPEVNIGKSKIIDRSIELRRDGKFRMDDDNKTVGKKEIDPSYRMAMQANEKNLKMDIMKYKMKAEEQEKTIDDKNKQIKQLKEQISELHRQTVEKGFYQEQINSKNVIIQKLQDTAKQLNKENSRLETKIIELERAVEEGKSNLQSSLQRARDQKERREAELGKELSVKKDEISLLNDEVRGKNNQISRIKKIIEDLQKSLESKTFEYEKSLQQERTEMSKLQSLLNQKIKQLQQMNKSAVTERQSLLNELKKKNEQVQKLQTQTNHLLGEVKEVSELQKYYSTYKTKHSDLQKAYEKLQEQKKEVQKHYLKLMESKEKDYGEFKEEQSGLISSYKKKNTQLNEKNKLQQQRIYQLQSRTTLLGADMEKAKRSFQLAQKELSSLTQNCKQLNLSIKQKDQLLLNKQKELSELQTKFASKEGLIKKDLDYKTQQLNKVTHKLAQIQHLFRQQKQNNQTLRFQATKIQGKNKLQEEIISRLNRQLEQTKLTLQKKQLQNKEQLKQLNQKLKLHQQSEKKLTKQLTQHQIQDLNRKNQIHKLNKQLQINKEKFQRQLKKTQQLQNHLNHLNHTISKLQNNLITANHELKQLHNSNKALQADFTKTEKIKTIIVEEKTSVQNQLFNLKKEIQEKTNKEASLNKDIKELKEELSKMTLKANNVIKDFETFKQNLYTTIESSFFNNNNSTQMTNNKGMMGLNLNLTKSFNFGLQHPLNSTHQRYNSANNIHSAYSSGGNTRRMNESEVLSLNNIKNHESIHDRVNNSSIYEPKFNQIIQSYGRQSQQAISVLQETVKKQKSQIQRLQRQSSQLSSKLQSTQSQTSSVIQALQRQLQSLSVKNQQATTEWEQKLMISQRSNRQKKQIISELNQQLEAINHQMAGNSRAHLIQLQELALKIQHLKGKLYELENKNDLASMTIISNEEKIFLLQSTVSQLQEQLEFQKEKVQRKDKLIVQHTSRIDQLAKFSDQIKKEKLELSKQLLNTQQKLQVEKESNNKHKRLLLQQQEKNKEIKGLTNNLMKEKETIVKNQIIKSEKVIELEDHVSTLNIRINQLTLQTDQKENTITQLKTQLKKYLLKIKETQQKLDKEQHQKLKLIDSLKEKEKKIQQKQLQIKNLQINLQKLLSKYQQDTKKLNSQHEQSVSKFTKQLQDKKTQILSLSNQIQKLTHLQKKLSEQNISLEEQIFFQKQTNSLANSRFDTMNRDIDDLQAKLSQAVREIDSLNEEVRDRQQKLFQLSNKLYSQDSKLDMKEIQLRERLEKLDIDWKNKYEQTLEDYQAKIQSYEREKYYLKQKLQEQLTEISKLQNQKRALMVEEEREKKIYQDKVKKIQTQKLTLLVQKNKEIEKLRQEIQDKEDKIKQLKHQKEFKEDDLRRLQEKLKDKQQRLSTQHQSHSLAVIQLQKQLQIHKKKDSQLKKYKQLMKNNLWSSEREIKRILQLHLKNIMALCEEDSKNNLIDLIKQVQLQLVKAIQFNLDSEAEGVTI